MYDNVYKHAESQRTGLLVMFAAISFLDFHQFWIGPKLP